MRNVRNVRNEITGVLYHLNRAVSYNYTFNGGMLVFRQVAVRVDNALHI